MSLAWALRPEPPMNACRFSGKPGHVESYFLRANDPTRPRALWLKATILAPLEGPAVAETWLIWFDGENKRTLATKRTWQWSEADFADAPDIRVGSWHLSLREGASASGHISSEAGEVRFELSGSPHPALCEPLSLYPSRLLREGPFPRSKLVTPFPWLRFQGRLQLGAQSVVIEDWDGMQGHNWGQEHAFEYAWGQCNFRGQNAPDTTVEGFTGRILVAGRPSPAFSALVVRRGEREYRFDGVFDLWRQEAHLGASRWSVRLRGGDGEARLRMDAAARPVACLGYANPNGKIAYCFNTKLADTLLEVHPRGEPAFTCRSAFGGALEFLRRQSDPRLTVV